MRDWVTTATSVVLVIAIIAINANSVLMKPVSMAGSRRMGFSVKAR